MIGIEELNKYLRPFFARIQMMITKGTLESVNDIDEIQLVKVSSLEGEVQENVERVQPYGLSTNPPVDSETMIACIGGNKDHPVAIVVDNGATRKKELEPGEVALYDHLGTFIYLTKDGDIHIKPNSENFRLEGNQATTGTIDADGNITSKGDVADSKGTLDQLRQEFNTFVNTRYNVHIHSTPVGPSGPPNP